MPGYIEDRWMTKKPDPATGKKRETARFGQGKRYRVAGIPGVKDRSFEKLHGPDGAKAWLAKAQHESTAGEFIDPRRGQMLLRDYIEKEWWARRDYDNPSTEATVKGRVWTHIVPHLGDYQLNAIKTQQLGEWLRTLKESAGPGTGNEAWRYLSAIFQAAIDDERLTRNPCRKQTTLRVPTRPPAKARAWPKERVLAVREAIDGRFRLCVDLGVGAGLRSSEVFGLSVDDIDFAGQRILVRRQVKKVGAKLAFALPKGEKTREVPVPEYLLKRIQEAVDRRQAERVTLPWKDPRPPKSDREAEEREPQTHALILTSARGGAIRRDGFDTRVWKPALAAAGVIRPPVETRQPIRHRPGMFRTVVTYQEAREDGFHALRHTFASVHLDSRENLVAVSKWLGHADPSITLRIYAHMMPEADGRGRSAMQNWFESP
ncbi:tyrosine-type recombinase/integrase [Streptomyces scabiei]|uniref:tyrosine-type recombinase/integrase n=1 Tax=Streptomyces scabiei TaxID=1930 RepID=UPI0029A57CB1|nr:tyrosine-type recombinase/integrase [Streptomyces scabiei]MDX3027881.1 tyrosine-type recombinase/integrase [Streptomyces scabiei]